MREGSPLVLSITNPDSLQLGRKVARMKLKAEKDYSKIEVSSLGLQSEAERVDARGLRLPIPSTLLITVFLCTAVLAVSTSAQAIDTSPVSRQTETATCSPSDVAQGKSEQCQAANATAQVKAKTIFSNLGTGTQLFNAGGGLPVSGPSSGTGTQAVAFPFTPSKGQYLEGMELPLWWRSGLNSVDVCLYSNADGLPGSLIECVVVYNLFPFGEGFFYPNCFWELPVPIAPWPCICWAVTPWPPYWLTKGLEYWVVVFPDPNEPNFWGGWYYNYEMTEGPYAIYNGSAWELQTGPLPAVGLYGTSSE